MKRIIILLFGVIVCSGVFMASGAGILSRPATGTPGLTSPSDTLGNRYYKVSPFMLDILSPSSGIQFYRDGIIFLSDPKNFEKMAPKHLSFGTQSVLSAGFNDTTVINNEPFDRVAPFSFPPDAASFANNWSTLYFTLINTKDSKEKIYRGDLKDGNWVYSAEPESFCSEKAIYTHPAVSEDGNLMVFSSDRSGSYGGLDLYVTRKVNGKWSEPVNLGNRINSTGNELYASLDSHNNLYFSSDGLPGEGGYDIFTSHFNGSGWDPPLNLTSAFNTHHDEIAFTIDKENDLTAFYTSRDVSGKFQPQLLLVRGIGPKASGTGSMTLSDRLLALAGAPGPMISETGKDIAVAPALAVNTPPPAIAVSTPPSSMEKRDSTTRTKPAEPVQEMKVSEEPLKEREITTAPTPVNVPDSKNAGPVYRIQITANTKPVGTYNVEIGGKEYSTFEYYYMGGYRTTVGEFNTLAEASRFQTLCKKEGFSQAFIAAFSNDKRISGDEARELEKQATAVGSSTTAKVTAPEKKTEVQAPPKTVVKTTPAVTDVVKEVVYRIQILANTKPVGSYSISIDNRAYTTYEYLYMGGYRTTIGEFSELAEAVQFQNKLRKSGYPQAFVVAFKDGVRSTDPALFR